MLPCRVNSTLVTLSTAPHETSGRIVLFEPTRYARRARARGVRRVRPCAPRPRSPDGPRRRIRRASSSATRRRVLLLRCVERALQAQTCASSGDLGTRCLRAAQFFQMLPVRGDAGTPPWARLGSRLGRGAERTSPAAGIAGSARGAPALSPAGPLNAPPPRSSSCAAVALSVGPPNRPGGANSKFPPGPRIKF